MEYYGLFRDAKHVNLYTVDWDGWDSVNKRFWFKWWSNIIDTIRLLWDPDNGRTISLFIDGEFRTELWRDIPLEIYPVINPRSPDRWSSVRLQDVPTLENACYKKVMELDPPPPSIARLPPPLRDQMAKRKRNDFTDLYKNSGAGVPLIGIQMAVKRRCTIPVSFPAIWDWSRWGEGRGWSSNLFIGYAHFDANIRQY